MIKNIKIGIKIATKNLEFIPEIYTNHKLIDYIEIIIMPDFTSNDIYIIKDLKIPYAVHIPNINYGINFGDFNKNDNNIKYINKINQFKDVLSPFCCIVHPESGDLDLSIANINKLKFKPIALENMTLKSLFGGTLLGYDPETLKLYFKRIKDLEFCLDINHAIKTAISKNIDYLEFIKKLLSFRKPIIFHISGGSLNKEVDEHLPLIESQYNLTEIKKILLNYGNIVNLTFETPRNYKNKIEDDLKNIKIFIKS